MPTIEVGDRSLYYEQYGKGDPVILAHAYLDDCSVWRAQEEILAQKHTVIVYDHRGHGKSDKPKSDYSIQTLADDLYALVVGLNLSTVALVGNSIGGATVLRFVLDHQSIVSKIVLVCTAAKFNTPLGNLLTLLPYRFFAWMNQRGKFYKPSQLTVSQAVERSLQVPKYAAHACWRGILEHDLRSRVSEIKVPTTIVVGEKDRSIPVSSTQFLQQAISGSRLVTIPDCGHVPQIERPEQFNKILTDFLD